MFSLYIIVYIKSKKNTCLCIYITKILYTRIYSRSYACIRILCGALCPLNSKHIKKSEWYLDKYFDMEIYANLRVFEHMQAASSRANSITGSM